MGTRVPDLPKGSDNSRFGEVKPVYSGRVFRYSGRTFGHPIVGPDTPNGRSDVRSSVRILRTSARKLRTTSFGPETKLVTACFSCK